MSHKWRKFWQFYSIFAVFQNDGIVKSPV